MGCRVVFVSTLYTIALLRPDGADADELFCIRDTIQSNLFLSHLYLLGLNSCGLIFVVYGLIQLLQFTGVLPADFLPYNDMLYGLTGACLFSFYLAYHTKLIVGGKHSKYQMNEKDYVFGASKFFFKDIPISRAVRV